MPEDIKGLRNYLSEIKNALARLETQLKERSRSKEKRLADLEKTRDDLFSKVNRLDRSLSRWFGAATAIGATMGTLLTVILKILGL